MKKKVRLPIDMILGNPALAGRDVNCEEERRQQPLGGGLVSQAIIVTCRDNDDKDEEDDNEPRPSGPSMPLMPVPGARRISPPMSIIAPIMKLLASRAQNRPDQPQPKISGPFPMPFRSSPFPPQMKEIIIKPSGPIMMSGPMLRSSALSGPFPGPRPSPFD